MVHLAAAIPLDFAIEVAAVIFGLLCVSLTIRQNVWCWPAGLVQVVLYIYIFYAVRLYSDVILHLVYVVLQLYGWHHWLHGGRGDKPLPVSRMPPAALVATLLGIATGTGAWGYLMASTTDAAVPYGDAFTTVASLAAQWLLARKRLESWLIWMAVDVVAIGIYYHKGLYPTTLLYALFLCMATAGFHYWRKSLHHTPAPPSPDEDDRADTREIRAPASRAPVRD